MAAVATLKTYTVTVWEKAEHWTFDAVVKAANDAEAWKLALKEFPKRSYSVREVRHYWTAGEA